MENRLYGEYWYVAALKHICQRGMDACCVRPTLSPVCIHLCVRDAHVFTTHVQEKQTIEHSDLVTCRSVEGCPAWTLLHCGNCDMDVTAFKHNEYLTQHFRQHAVRRHAHVVGVDRGMRHHGDGV